MSNIENLFPVTNNPVSSDESGTYGGFCTKTDTTENIEREPKLTDFGGDLSKRWYIDYYLEDRKRAWIASRPLKTRAERAKKELEKIKKKVSRYLSSNAPAILPEHYSCTAVKIDLFNVIDSMDIKKKTSDSYKSDLRIVQRLFPEMDFTAVQLKIALEGRYKNKKSAKNRFLSLQTIFNFAKNEKLIGFNPFDDKVKPIRINEESDSNFPFNEYERAIIEPELKKKPNLWLYTRFIYYSFSRPNEIINLRVQDINLRTRTIRIQPEFAKPGRTLIKPIVKPLLDLILEFKVLENPNSFYVFGDKLERSPEPCYKNHAANLHRDILKKQNMYRPRETVPYSWKPTGNINAYLAGMDLKLIQQINGHKSIQTTEIYLRKLGLWLEKQAHDIVF